MSLPMEKWPVTQDIGSTTVPEEEVVNTKFCAHVIARENIIDYKKFIRHSYQFVMRLTATLLQILSNKSFKNNALILPRFLKQAEIYMLQQSSKLTQQLIDKGQLKSLRPEVNQHGIIVLRSRAEEGMRVHYGHTEFPILAYDDPIAYLWIKLIHEEDHGGKTKVVAKARRKFWIIHASKLAEKVKRSCYNCHLKDKVLAEQQMAPLPSPRVVMSPTFNNISLDLFGHFDCQATYREEGLGHHPELYCYQSRSS